MAVKDVVRPVLTHLLAFAVGCVVLLAVLISGIFEPKKGSEQEDTPPKMESSQEVDTMERVLFPTLNLDAPLVREMHLYGDFAQYVGDAMFALSFLKTDEFGPYTVYSVQGMPGGEIIRMGFYSVSVGGDLILNFRFKENADGEFEQDIVEEIWRVTVDYPFINLSKGPYTLSTTFNYNEDEEFDYDAYFENREKSVKNEPG